MQSPFTIPPPYDWLREMIGIDTIPAQPVFVRTRRIRGQLRHERIAELPKTTGRNTIPVAACINNRESTVRRIEAPFASITKAKRVFPALLDLRLPFPEAECERVFLDIHPTANGGTQALAVAARHTTIRERIKTCREQYRDPLLLDQEAVALWTQSMLETPAATDPAAMQMVVALHDTGNTLCIGRNGRLSATANLSRDTITDIERRLKALDIPANTALDVRWTGSGAVDHENIKTLIAAFEKFRPAAQHHRHHDPETMLARALTTRAMTAGPCRCNLRSGSMIHPSLQHRFQKYSITAALAIAITGLCLWIIGNLWIRQTESQRRQLQDTVIAQTEQITGRTTGLRGADAVSDARQSIAQMTAGTRPFADLLHTRTSEDMEAAITTAQKHRIAIHELKLEEETVTLLGSTDAWDTATAFVRDLETKFGPLTLQRQWDAETTDGKAVFLITTRR